MDKSRVSHLWLEVCRSLGYAHSKEQRRALGTDFVAIPKKGTNEWAECYMTYIAACAAQGLTPALNAADVRDVVMERGRQKMSTRERTESSALFLAVCNQHEYGLPKSEFRQIPPRGSAEWKEVYLSYREQVGKRWKTLNDTQIDRAVRAYARKVKRAAGGRR